MRSSTPKSKPPSQLERMFQAAARAPLSLSQCFQPHALLPTGNSVPLSSEAYYTWVSSALADAGIQPSAAQLGHLIRQLNSQAMLCQREEIINLRIAHPAPNTYLLDLANPSCEVIHLSADGWKVTSDFDTRFYRPESIEFFQSPVKVKSKLHQALEEIFQLDEAKSKLLSTWLIDGLLPNQVPPTLIITGKCRHAAASKIRNFIDPMMSPLHPLPVSKKAMARLAVTNRVMAFGIYKTLSANKIEQLNELRTGMLVELKRVSSNNDPISHLIRRPIILAAEQAPTIHEGQLEIEINNIALVKKSDVLAAILDAAVAQIRKQNEPEERQVYLERAATSLPDYDPVEQEEPQGPGP